MASRWWRRGAGVVLVALILGGASWFSLSAAAAAAPARVRLGRAPRHPPRSAVVGTLASGTRLSITVTLKPSDPSALAEYATAVSTPRSPLYHHFLTVAEFRRRFGATDASVQAVKASLAAQGLHPGPVSANGLAIPLTSDAATLGHAFSVSFQLVKLPSGRSAFANAQPPQLSSSVAGAVQSVVGLDNLAQAQPLVLGPPSSHRLGPRGTANVVTSGPQACSGAAGAASKTGPYTASQLASAYGLASLYGAGDQAAGQTVALVEFEPYRASDISSYQSCYGTSGSVSNVNVDGGPGSGSGKGEAALDIEDVTGLAPKASILVYQGPQNAQPDQVIDTYSAIVVQDKASVISTSWGDCEADLETGFADSENTLFQEAATQGQSIFAASGDNGSEDCGTSDLAVDDPASQPYVTGVGGTTLSALGPPRSESVWNDTCGTGSCGGGGGVSSLWPMPSYQSGAPAALGVISPQSSGTQCNAASGSYCREVPDVSADADPSTGYVIYYRGRWSAIGGTSAAAPLWAALAALTDASSRCGGGAIGFANPLLYAAAATGYSADFNDVTSGGNDITGGNGGEFAAGPGFDMASGLGTPNGSALAQALCTGAYPVTVTSPGNQSTPIEAAASVPISASDANGKTLSYSATGLPPGLAIDSSSGTISGTPSSTGQFTVTVTATDTQGAHSSTTFTWTVVARATTTTVSCAPSELLSGSTTTCTVTVSESPGGGGNAVSPTGSVVLADTPPGSGSFPGGASCTLSATGTAGTASCQISYTPSKPGSPTMSATYAGDQVHSPSSSSGFALTVPAPPAASISSPAGGGGYSQGDSVPTSFSCTDGAGGPGIATCVDSNNATGGAGALDTSTYGQHTYAVTATSNDGLTGSTSITYWVADPPTASIASPASGGTYEVGQAVPTSFSCAEGTGGPGIATCVDSGGSTGTTGTLDTSAAGSHTYTVTATSQDGLSASASISYTVIAPPTATITAPPGGGVYSLGQSVPTAFSCAQGSGGQPVATCVDSGGASGGSGTLDTSTYGSHSYTVTATSQDGYTGSATISYWVANPPTATVSMPLTGGTYALGQSVPTSFACSDETGPGITTCQDSNGATGGTGALDTSTLGPHTYTVTAKSGDGLTSTSPPVSYQVVNGPSASISAPSAGGTYALDQHVATTFTCRDASGGPGIATCAGSPALDTSTYGPHTYTVTATSNDGASATASIGYVVAAPPSATISVPTSGARYTLGQSVASHFSCADGLDGPGIASCQDSNGAGAGAGALSTSTLGPHSYAVTAVSRDGQTSRASVTYTVIPPPPPRSLTAPAVTGSARPGRTLACSPGAWTGSPTRLSYQWTRDGTALAGVAGQSYRVRAIDEGTTLSCTVVAANLGGPSAPVTSRGVLVPIPFVAGCPAAGGRLAGAVLGLARLGMTRVQVQTAYRRRSSAHATANRDGFCLTPAGVRVGYPSARLLGSLTRKLRAALAGHVIWATTGNPYYAIDGIRAGATFAALERALPGGALLGGRWYLARTASVTDVVEVVGGVVQEVGIADARLTRTRAAELALIRELS